MPELDDVQHVRRRMIVAAGKMTIRYDRFRRNFISMESKSDLFLKLMEFYRTKLGASQSYNTYRDMRFDRKETLYSWYISRVHLKFF